MPQTDVAVSAKAIVALLKAGYLREDDPDNRIAVGAAITRLLNDMVAIWGRRCPAVPRRLRPIRTPLSPDVALRSARRHGEDVILCAFDLLELDGWDMRPVPIEEQGYACEAAAPVDHGIACF